MAKLLQITFYLPNAPTAADQKAAWERAHAIAAWPGLIWKIWIADPSQSLYGGLYLFTDTASVQAYLNGSIADRIRSIPGIAGFTPQIFDVNPQLSQVTRGPIPSPPAPMA